MSRSTFTDSEAAGVLGRAARLQAAADADRSDVLTLDDLKVAAAAAGIAPAFVEAAARMGLPERPAPAPFLGVPMGVERVRIVEGRLSDADWASVVGDLRHRLGGTGRDVSSGDVQAWERYPLRIVAETTGPVTRLVATADWSRGVRTLLWTASIMSLTTLLVLVATVADRSTSAGLLGFFLAVTALAAGITGSRFRAKEARVGRKFEAALDRIAARIALPDAPTTAAATTAIAAASAQAPAPLLDLGGESAAETDASATEASRAAPKRA